VQFSALEIYAAEMRVAVSVTPELQDSDYESGVAQLNGEPWHVRTARNTPAKAGAFLAFWRRDLDGKTTPFGDDDVAAGLLVFVEQGNRRGVFRFTAAHLSDLGVTAGRRAGKRGFRVYPNWCTGLNPSATATQRAQASAFQELRPRSNAPS
jgi:hypothetical protein